MLLYDLNKGRLCEKLIHLTNINSCNVVRAVENSKENLMWSSSSGHSGLWWRINLYLNDYFTKQKTNTILKVNTMSGSWGKVINLSRKLEEVPQQRFHWIWILKDYLSLGAGKGVKTLQGPIVGLHVNFSLL